MLDSSKTSIFHGTKTGMRSSFLYKPNINLPIDWTIRMDRAPRSTLARLGGCDS